MGTQLLPLFPLSVVLLPATPLPLHIFEDRYKEMMGDIIPARSEFGVVLAKDDGIVNVGCTATVDRVVQRYPDGQLDLVAIGQRRFQVLSLDEEKSYLRASVEYFNDEEAGEVPVDLRKKAIAGYQRLRDIEKPSVIIEPRLEGPQLSFQLAQFIADLDKRQTVLSLRSEVERLEFLVNILPDYIVQRERITLAKRVAPLNGHAKHITGQ
ncbi:MAG: LON peptidase substrate-binding domain-containing protein [Acidobacteriaceae bacterium]|nr:LON peptidase substrate-binding domain-containing protein [Acidobacteriaceae bacterium]MBV9767761.1 LON peptidase substrate-binding domain-containing protein [Acidobacteriaceae bacterium]